MQVTPGPKLALLLILAFALLAPSAMAADVEFVKTLVQTPAPEVTGFINSFWSGKYFFIRSGACTSSTPGYFGTWVFDEAGNPVGERDTAWDSGNFDCWQHTWQLGAQIVRVDDNGVIFSNGQNFRPPIYYSIRNGKVEVISRANQNPPFTSCTGCHPGTDESAIIGTVAVTQNGYVVGQKQTVSSVTTTVYRLPAFQEVGTGPAMNGVIGAIGNYVIGWESTVTPAGRVTTGVVYRMSNDGQLTFAKNIPPLPDEWGVTADQWNPNRGMLHGTIRENGVPKTIWKIYEATPTDLVEKYSKEVSGGIDPVMGSSLTPRPVGLAGDYIAVIAYRPAANGGTAATWEARPIELWKTTGDQKLILQAPPGVVVTQGQAAQPAMGGSSVGISKTGKVTVATAYAVYLYQIKDFQGNTVPPTTSPPCKIAGASCTGFAECCSQSCNAGVCAGTTAPPATTGGCETDDDCDDGWCNDGTCEIECENDDECSEDEWCEAGLCEPIPDDTIGAQFTASSATCTIGTLKAYCTTPISWTSTGTDKIQLWRDAKRQIACATAGTAQTKSIRATTTARTYQLYAATSCAPTGVNNTPILDSITVQGTRG